MHAQHYVLCYDIADRKRLAKVHRVVSKLMWRLQYSVYYAEVLPTQMTQLVAALEPLIDPKADDIRVYAVEPLATAVRLGHCGERGWALFDGQGRSMWGGVCGADDSDDDE